MRTFYLHQREMALGQRPCRHCHSTPRKARRERLIADSLINGIPIVANNFCRSSKLVGKGSVVLELPEALRARNGEPTNGASVREWREVVKRIWNAETHYAKLCRHADEAAKLQGISHKIDPFLKVVSPLVMASKAPKPVEANTPAGSMRPPVRQALAKKPAKNVTR